MIDKNKIYLCLSVCLSVCLSRLQDVGVLVYGSCMMYDFLKFVGILLATQVLISLTGFCVNSPAQAKC